MFVRLTEAEKNDMKWLIFLLVVLPFSVTYGQVRFSEEYDKISIDENDSIKMWSYELKLIKNGKDGLAGEINFKRSKPISSWYPSISFKIYQDLNEELTKRKALNIKIIS